MAFITKESILNLMKIFLIIVFSSLISSCSEQIDSGSKLGLKIGQSKEEIINSLAMNVNITHVKPDLDKIVEVENTSKNISNLLDNLLEQQGIVIEGKSPKIYIKISIENNLVKDIYLAPVNRGESLGINIGMSKRNVGELLLDSMSSNKINHIFNFIPDDGWIEINGMSPEDKVKLFSYNTWGFNETNKYSFSKLHFINGYLSTIDYKWSPVELP